MDGYGYLINNIWDGAMALHAQNKIDLLFHGTSMRADRITVIECTTDLLRVELKKTCSSIFQIGQTENFKFLIFKYTNNLQSCFFCHFIRLFFTYLVSVQCVHQVADNLWIFAIHSIYPPGGVTTHGCKRCCHIGLRFRFSTAWVFWGYQKVGAHHSTIYIVCYHCSVFTSHYENILVLLQSPSHAIKTVDDFISLPSKSKMHDTIAFIFKRKMSIC